MRSRLRKPRTARPGRARGRCGTLGTGSGGRPARGRRHARGVRVPGAPGLERPRPRAAARPRRKRRRAARGVSRAGRGSRGRRDPLRPGRVRPDAPPRPPAGGAAAGDREAPLRLLGRHGVVGLPPAAVRTRVDPRADGGRRSRHSSRPAHGRLVSGPPGRAGAPPARGSVRRRPRPGPCRGAARRGLPVPPRRAGRDTVAVRLRRRPPVHRGGGGGGLPGRPDARHPPFVRAPGRVGRYHGGLDDTCDVRWRGGSGRVRSLLLDRFAPLGVPVAAGLPFGHAVPNVPLPVGARASWDGGTRTLVLEEEFLS